MKKKSSMKNWARLVALASVALLAACGGDSDAFEPRENSNNFRSLDRGDACERDTECRAGLLCLEGVCEYEQDLAEGAECKVSLQCGEGLHCDLLTSTCAPAGDAAQDALCDTTADCEPGLVCTPRGFSASCQPGGEGDVGATCETAADCLPGLGCAAAPGDETARCTAGMLALPTPWSGVDCSASDNDEGPPRFFFEVPGDEPLAEFFRLPMPSDARLRDGKPDLTGFPVPGPGVVGFDIVQTYVDAVEAEQDRWGMNQAILLRASATLDFDSLTANDKSETEEDERTLKLIDISPDSPTYGESTAVFWEARGGSGSKRRYICQNWLAVRPFWGRPLRPETTYALIVTSDVKAAAVEEGGAPRELEQDADFAAMLADGEPSEGRLKAAWERHAPLRAWMGEQGMSAEDVAVAVVFTTGDPFAQTSQLREVVRGAEVTASELTLCDEGVTSPCDDGLEGEEHVRGCFGARQGFSEIHGKLSLPVVQRGEAPYLEEGGGVAASPEIERSEDVCMAMTVPDGEMPEAGWPVLLYAHGTGGDFLNQVDQVVPLVNEITLPDGSTTGVLTIGWDQVQHFNRRGDTELEPEPLVFNYANPPAARGNFMQGAADVFALVKYVEQLEIPAEQSPTGQAIKADPTQIYFMGHSQGGTTGPLALPFEPNVRAAVLSGAGGGLTLGLLGKTSPVNSPEALKLALQDPDVGQMHPAISLVQGYFEPVDPINYAPLLAKYQLEGLTQGMHVFHTFGVGDTFTPPGGLKALARALYATYLGPIFDDFNGGVLIKDDGAVSANRRVGEELYTVVGRQYDPKDAYDGHFVIFRDEQAQADLVQFLSTAIGEERPSLGQE